MILNQNESTLTLALSQRERELLKRNAQQSQREMQKRKTQDACSFSISFLLPKGEKVRMRGGRNRVTLTPALSQRERENSPRGTRGLGIVGIFLFAALLSVGGVGMAAEVTVMGVGEAVKVELPTKVKDISGKVLARTRTNLSVETVTDGTSSMEYVVPFDRKTKLRGYRNFAEIRKGDTVSARLKQSYEVDLKGKELIRGTIATQIALVKISTDGKLAS